MSGPSDDKGGAPWNDRSEWAADNGANVVRFDVHREAMEKIPRAYNM